MTLGFLSGSRKFCKLLWVSSEVLFLHGYASIHWVARSCTATAYRWLFRDSQLSLRTLWSAVIKSPKFSARGTATPWRLLHGALVILVGSKEASREDWRESLPVMEFHHLLTLMHCFLLHCGWAIGLVVVTCRAIHSLLPLWEHRCTVGFDRDPPVWHSHPGRMMRVSERQLFVVVVVVTMGLTCGECEVSGWVYCKHQHPSSIALLLRREEIACSTLCKCTSRYSNTIFAFSAYLTPKRVSSYSDSLGFNISLPVSMSPCTLNVIPPCSLSSASFLQTPSDSAGILRLPCTAVSETSRVRLHAYVHVSVLEPLLGTAPGVLQSAVFSRQAPQALRVQRHTFTLRKCSLWATDFTSLLNCWRSLESTCAFSLLALVLAAVWAFISLASCCLRFMISAASAIFSCLTWRCSSRFMLHLMLLSIIFIWLVSRFNCSVAAERLVLDLENSGRWCVPTWTRTAFKLFIRQNVNGIGHHSKLLLVIGLHMVHSFWMSHSRMMVSRCCFTCMAQL